MTTSVPRRKLLSTINRLLTASRPFGSFGRSFNGTCKDTGFDAVFNDISSSRLEVSGESVTGHDGGGRDWNSKFVGIALSRHYVSHTRRNCHSRAGFKDSDAVIELVRQHDEESLDRLPNSSPGRSPISDDLKQECPPSWIFFWFHCGDSLEGVGRTDVNNGLTVCPNFFLSPKLTNFNCEGTDIASSTSSDQHLAASGRARSCEGAFPSHCRVQGRLYFSSSQRNPSASEKHVNDDNKADEAARHDGKEAGEKKTWIQAVSPTKLWAYSQLARLDKPIGTWLLAWPCFWSICLAAPSGALPDLEIVMWFGLGSILLRGAGCTVNDLLDSDIDVKVERTRQRPIASGALTPFEGLCFLGFQLSLGLGVLLQLNDFSKILGASSLLLVGTYPLMKRWTFWPQAYLGLTLNWGALLGWAAVHGTLDLSVVCPLYASGVCWTLVYDTIYAHQDKEDDIKVGVKSTALQFGNKTKPWLAGFSIGCVTCLTLAGFNCGLAWPFYAGMAATAGHLAWQVSTVDIHNRVDCNSKFVSNKWFGAIVCSAIIFGKLAESST